MKQWSLWFMLILLSGCASQRPVNLEYDKVWRNVDLSNVIYVSGLVEAVPRDMDNNRKFIKKGYMTESAITQQLAVSLSAKLSGLNRRAGQESLRVVVDVTLNYRRTDNFPFGDNIKNLEFDYVLVLRDDEGKIREYHSRKEAAYYMFTNIPETQEEYFQMEKAFVVRVADSIIEKLRSF